MASHPYISGPGSVTQMIGYLRKNFPASVTADTVKKFQIAPKNESYVINALQFLGLIDEEGRRFERGHQVLLLSDADFPSAFEDLIRDAYKDLFEIRGDDAWSLSKNELVGYFRTTDKTSEVIGGRQAGLFQALSALAGRESPTGAKPKQNSLGKKKAPRTTAKATKQAASVDDSISAPHEVRHGSKERRDVAMTVRIEINLPAEGSRETYDHIFKSIRANLLNEYLSGFV